MNADRADAYGVGAEIRSTTLCLDTPSNAVCSGTLVGGQPADTPCSGCDCLLSRCDEVGPNRKCCPDCRHPRRFQRHRTKGSRLPAGVLSIARPSRYGNPFRIEGCRVVGMNWSEVVEWDHGIGAMPDPDVVDMEAADRRSAVEHAVDLYRQLLAVRQDIWEPERFATWIADVRGRDLACYCKVTESCHGDPLLEVGNAAEINVGAWRHCMGCGKALSTHGPAARTSAASSRTKHALAPPQGRHECGDGNPGSGE